MCHNEPWEDGHGRLQHGRKKNDQLFRFRKRSIVLLFTYLSMLITPWALTCILVHHPISRPSYLDQAIGLTERDISEMEQWYSFIRILDGITSTIAVPVVSALLAQAAVIYTQRRKSSQKLGIRQMLALADGGWKNPIVLWNAVALPGKREELISSTPFLWGAAALTLLGKCTKP